LRHFGEQDVGVPIFAALDGTVIARHDGEFDRNSSLNPSAVANYVILDHGGGHHSLYWHMRSNSVAVALNQVVPAGTQLGLAASSRCRFRYKRPSRTVFYDRGTFAFGNNATAYRGAQWWWNYTLSPDTSGTWTLDVFINAALMVTAPFLVVNSGGAPTNRPPN